MNDLELLNGIEADMEIGFEEKQGLFETFPDIKIEPSLTFTAHNLVKDEFASDEDRNTVTNINSEGANESNSSEDFDVICSNVRRNRRKASAPQRAVQIEFGQAHYLENSSESSQDHNDNVAVKDIQTLDINFHDKEHSYIKDDLDIKDNDELAYDLIQDINEDDIFKDLQEEAG